MCTNERWYIQGGEFKTVCVDTGSKWRDPVVCVLFEDVTPLDSVTIGPWLSSYPNSEQHARCIARVPDMLRLLQEVLPGAESMGWDVAEKIRGLLDGVHEGQV